MTYLFFISLALGLLHPAFFLLSLFIVLVSKFRDVEKKIEEKVCVKTRTDNALTLFKYQKSQYLKSNVWKEKRKQVLSRDNYTCQSCGATNQSLHVHHKSGYSLIPNEPIGCLVSLCNSCHEHQHKVYGYPQTYEQYMQWNAPLIKKGKI